jgi:diguanylate cyclase (GGDEF)-like protein
MTQPNTAAAEVDRLLQAVAPEFRGASNDVPRLQAELAEVRAQCALAQAELAACRLQLHEARQAARNDPLTGLPNRRAFDAVSAGALLAHERGPRMLALLFVDLDGFKALNDRLGHAFGDEMLRTVGARLSHAVRRGDLVCRLGGDEFACLLPGLQSGERARTIARTLVRAISSPCRLGPHTVSVRASIGVAMYPADGATIGTLLRRADEAMYRAKSHRLGVAMATACAIERSRPAAAGTV